MKRCIVLLLALVILWSCGETALLYNSSEQNEPCSPWEHPPFEEAWKAKKFVDGCLAVVREGQELHYLVARLQQDGKLQSWDGNTYRSEPLPKLPKLGSGSENRYLLFYIPKESFTDASSIDKSFCSQLIKTNPFACLNTSNGACSAILAMNPTAPQGEKAYSLPLEQEGSSKQQGENCLLFLSNSNASNE